MGSPSTRKALLMSYAIIGANGGVIRTGSASEPDEQIASKDVADTSKLARLLTKLFRVVASLLRRRDPQIIDYEDLTVSGSTGSPQRIRLTHKFGGRVRWSICDWATSGTVALSVQKDAVNTTTDVLVLLVWNTGTMTIRVESAS
jgi:hypothetical protein